MVNFRSSSITLAVIAVLMIIQGCASFQLPSTLEESPDYSMPEMGKKPPQNPDPLVAFPGAVGFGRFAEGGRGGDVYIVTNLNDSGPGSFRWAVEQLGPRTVVFEVSGIIDLLDEVTISDSHITIAGQTSPGGITLRGARIKVRASHVIIRGIRMRPGDAAQGQAPQNRDGFSTGDQSVEISDIIFDHCSATWAIDENGSTVYLSTRTTIQHCIFAEGLRNSIHPQGSHSMGYLFSEGDKVTFYHNAFFSNNDRNPKIQDATNVEVINNLGYNWRSDGMGVSATGASTVNSINNYYKHGPDTIDRPAFYLRAGNHRIYLKGNIDTVYRPNASQGKETDVAHSFTSSMISKKKVFNGSGISAMSASDVPNAVLNNVGATVPQLDAVDARILNTFSNNSGAIIDSPSEVGGYPAISTPTAPLDTDRDGMPDAWEDQQGLNKNDPSDRNGDINGNGYTNLEDYINSFF